MAVAQDLKIRYIGDAAGLQKTIRGIDSAHGALASRLKSIGSKISSVGSTMSRSFTLPILAGFAVGINEATEFNQVNGQTVAALRSTGAAANVTQSHVADLAGKIGKLSAQDGELVQASQNVLLTFTQIRNETGKGNAIFDRASLAVADLSARLGTDMSSAAIQVGKALNDPIKGVSALGRAGVQFTEQQKKMITRMVEGGDTLGAQKVILAELETQFGGSAKAAGKAASPFVKLKLVALDVAESVGVILLPVVSQLTGWLGRLAEKFRGLSPEMQRVIVTVLAVLAAVGPVLYVVGKLVSGIGAVIKVFGVLSKVMMANPWILLIAATIALVILIVKNWDTIKAFVFKIWDAIKAAAAAVWDKIGGVIGVFVKIAVGYFKIWWAVVRGIFRGIKAIASGVWKAIQGVVRVVVRFITGYVKAWWAVVRVIFAAVRAVWSEVWKAIQGVVRVVVSFITGYVKGQWEIWKSVFQKVKDFVVGVWNTIKDVAVGVWRTIKDVISGVWDSIAGIVKDGANVLIGALNLVIKGLNTLIRGVNLVKPGSDIGSIPEIPQLARGVRNFRGGLAIVGERGPELVSLSRGASVSPLQMSTPQAMRVQIVLDRRRYGRQMDLDYLTYGR